MNEIRVGVLGLGFIGQTHVRSYHDAQAAGLPVRLAAVADQNPGLLSGSVKQQGNIETTQEDFLFDPAHVRTTTEADELIASDDIDLISICTHTDTHVELATRVLNAGKHVLVEKPIARSSDEIARLAQAAEEAARRGVLCMPAMCMRFWPAWAWLRGRIQSNEFGSARSATFQRLGSTPGWSDGFYKDKARSGGALLDLHIHDTDFVTFCFGKPNVVVSTGDEDHVSTQYSYSGSPVHVTAEGCWDRHPSAPFVMRFSVCFERATVEFQLGAENELLVHDDSGSHPIPMSTATGWDMQIRAMVQAIHDRLLAPPVTMTDALGVMKILEAERKSLLSGRPQHLEH